MKQWKCGAVERKVTPPLGLSIPGYFGPRWATGVKDDLFAEAVVIDDGENAVAMVSIDICDFKAKLSAQIRHGVEKKLGFALPVMVAATHAHTGSPSNYTCLESPKDDKHIAFLVKNCIEAVVEAYENRVPVKAGYAKGEERRISFCRNFHLNDGTIKTNPGRKYAHMIVKPVSEIDYTVGVLRFDDEKGNTIAHVINFACHPDVVGGKEYCADYIGELRRQIKAVYGQDSIVAFFNGCAGDINHIDAMQYLKDPDFRHKANDHYIWMGQCLAETVLGIEKDMKLDMEPCVAVTSRTFREARRQPTEEMIAEAREILANPENYRTDERIYAKERMELHDKPHLFSNVEIQTIRVGDVGISALPGEIFAEIGFEIKADSPFAENMVVELANATNGYLVTEPCFSAGVYEAKLARDNSYFTPDTAHKMARVALELLNKMAD